ncbi:hypothetical protein ACO0K9_11015 [Undibacterium sp. Ji50W]|uniref:hypothetical protein n=1 Tax=Undibacterium sp. Ji50W TaxID=3413041 RepID=UPI003BF2EA72
MARQRKLYAWLCDHSVACFVLLTVSFLVFGKLSFDLIHLFSANADYLLDNGWIGLMEGGLQQLLELLATSCGAMIAYLLFKLCENALVERLRHRQNE